MGVVEFGGHRRPQATTVADGRRIDQPAERLLGRAGAFGPLDPAAAEHARARPVVLVEDAGLAGGDPGLAVA